jgi:hypothetical protein
VREEKRNEGKQTKLIGDEAVSGWCKNIVYKAIDRKRQEKLL